MISKHPVTEELRAKKNISRKLWPPAGVFSLWQGGLTIIQPVRRSVVRNAFDPHLLCVHDNHKQMFNLLQLSKAQIKTLSSGFLKCRLSINYLSVSAVSTTSEHELFQIQFILVTFTQNPVLVQFHRLQSWFSWTDHWGAAHGVWEANWGKGSGHRFLSLS